MKKSSDHDSGKKDKADNKAKIRSILNTCFGILFFYAAGAYFLEGEVVGISFLVVGAVLIPPLANKLSRMAKAVIIIVCALAFLIHPFPLPLD